MLGKSSLPVGIAVSSPATVFPAPGLGGGRGEVGGVLSSMIAASSGTLFLST